MHVSLAWTDAPANPGAARTFTNDLGVEFRDAAGNFLCRGSVGFRDGTTSKLGAVPDRLNHLDHVTRPAIAARLIVARAAAMNLSADLATPGVNHRFALVALTLAA